MKKRLVIVFALLPFVGGCMHALGYAGQNPGYIKCKGKGVINASGALNANAGIGGNELNHFTITADCGDGFEFSQGNPKDETPVK